MIGLLLMSGCVSIIILYVGTEWIPQVGLSFRLPWDSEIKLMASKGFRYPTIRELYMFRPANADLNPEKLWSYELSYSQRLLQGRLSYGVNAFDIDGKDLIMRVPVDGRQMNVNTGKVENAGVEAQVAYRLASAWSLDANYSYLHMDNPVLASPEHQSARGSCFFEGTLVRVDRLPVCCRTLHGGESGGTR